MSASPGDAARPFPPRRDQPAHQCLFAGCGSLDAATRRSGGRRRCWVRSGCRVRAAAGQGSSSPVSVSPAVRIALTMRAPSKRTHRSACIGFWVRSPWTLFRKDLIKFHHRHAQPGRARPPGHGLPDRSHPDHDHVVHVPRWSAHGRLLSFGAVTGMADPIRNTPESRYVLRSRTIKAGSPAPDSRHADPVHSRATTERCSPPGPLKKGFGRACGTNDSWTSA
jgi:hypothetical protein